jgi:hypothetical protein
MIPFFRTKLRKIATALCVLLALVFVQMGSASAVNDIQHRFGDRGHEHGVVSLTAIDDHHHDHEDDGDGVVAAVDSESAAGETGFTEHTNHHHHSDTPTGFASTGPAVDSLLTAAARTLIGRSDQALTSLQPLGPERPPKALTTFV